MSGHKLMTFCIFFYSFLISRLVTRLSILHIYTQIIVVLGTWLSTYPPSLIPQKNTKNNCTPLWEAIFERGFPCTHLIYSTKIVVELSSSLLDSGMITVRLEFRPRIPMWINCSNLDLNLLNSGIIRGVE